MPVIRSLGADLIGISPELPDNTLTMAEKHAIPIDILSDATSEVLKEYRLWFAVPAEVKALYLEKFGLNLEKYNGAGDGSFPSPRRMFWIQPESCGRDKRIRTTPSEWNRRRSWRRYGRS